MSTLAAAAATTSAAAPPTSPAVRRRRLRTVAWVVAGLLTVAAVGALTARPSSRTYLDPESASPGGARALAQLLRQDGVTVERVTDRSRALAATAGTTLVVAYPELLSQPDLEALDLLPGDVVLLGAPAAGGPTFGAEVVGRRTEVTGRDPSCALPAATLAGVALTGGDTFRLRLGPADTGTACYPAGAGAALVQVTNAQGRVRTTLGTGVTLTNDRLADDGNAALGMNVLGRQPAVLWWLPTPDLGGQQSLTSLLPHAVWPTVAAAALVLLLLAAWRGRRLGRVVVEPLPVVVRASETTEGRARLYQRARATDTAAAHLRTAAVARLTARLALPRGSGPAAVVAAVSARTGRPAESMSALLYGRSPDGEPALVALANQLDAVEEEVERS